MEKNIDMNLKEKRKEKTKRKESIFFIELFSLKSHK